MFLPISNKGFTLIELVVVMMLIGVLSTIGMGMANQLKLSNEAKYANQDLLVVMRGLQDNWLGGNACTSTMPAGLPATSPYGTAYSVNCYQQGFGVSVNLPTEIAQRIVLAQSTLTTINSTTSRLSTSASAPFISDGGYFNRYVYITY